MEKAIFISDPGDLKYFYLSRFQRIYFGNEFCLNHLPTPGQLQSILRFADGENVAFTLVTPFFQDHAYPGLEQLLDLLPAGSEVVFNDWGLAGAIAERRLVPVHGRLLCSVVRDPRIPRDFAFMAYFRSHNLQPPYMQLLRDKGVPRFELDNVRQGYDLEPVPGLAASLYYPFVFCSVTRKCIFANTAANPAKFRIAANCSRACLHKRIKTRVDNHEIFIEGNAQYYVNESRPASPGDWGVDRTVFMPVFPNHNSAPDDDEPWDWSYPYKRGGLEKCWGETPDETVKRIVADLAHPGRNKILDIGCGTGKHSLLFDPQTWDYTGLDIAGEAIRTARSRHPDRRFVLGNLLDIEGLDAPFDLLLDYGCFHTIPPWKRRDYFSAAGRLAKPGAHFILAGWESEETETPLLYVHDRLPEWGCSREKIKDLAQGAFEVSGFESRLEWGRAFFYALMRRKP